VGVSDITRISPALWKLATLAKRRMNVKVPASLLVITMVAPGRFVKTEFSPRTRSAEIQFIVPH
jgi:hypothetical protein